MNIFAIAAISFVAGGFCSLTRDLKNGRCFDDIVRNITQCGALTTVGTMLVYGALVHSFGAP